MPEWTRILFQSLGLFALVLILARLSGRRQTARMTYFDLIVAITVGVLAAALSVGLVPNLPEGLVALAVWVGLPMLLYLGAMKSKSLRDLIQGRETILINRGKVLEDKLMEARLTSEDLLSQLRRKNIYNFADVEFAVLEADGEISVLPQKANQPLTPKSIGLKAGQESAPQAVILDGQIMDEALTNMGVNRNWLQTELEKIGVAVENVYLAQVDSTGQLYLDLFNDQIMLPKPTSRELAYLTLKKCQADCELFALATRDAEAKKMYEKCAEKLDSSLNELMPYLVK